MVILHRFQGELLNCTSFDQEHHGAYAVSYTHLDVYKRQTSFKWGIPVDFDNKHVVYVLLDALTNYITGIGYDCDGNSTEQFKRDWPADLHLIGKDIILSLIHI